MRILNLSELGANFWGSQGKGEAFCTVRPSPLDVQRALFTVKPALLDVQRTLCTLAPRWGCQSLYIYWTHGPEIIHFGNLGSLAQKWLKMAPESSILTIWAAWPRNVQNGFQIVLSRLRPISHRKVGWLLAYFQIGCFLLPSRYDFIWKEALEHAPPQNNQPFGIAFLA